MRFLKVSEKSVKFQRIHHYTGVETHYHLNHRIESENTAVKTMIYCEPTEQGVHSFFLVTEGQEYYLFSQNYRKGVHAYYSKGVSLVEAINYSKTHNDNALIRTMSKLPMYIKYIEKEYGIEVLERTKRKRRCSSCFEMVHWA